MERTAQPVQSYRDLRVWQAAMDLAENCYLLTRSSPRDELYGMTSQVRRAAASVPANIAEGYGREMRGEYVQFLRIAQGSLKELETHLVLASRVEVTTSAAIQPILIQSESVGELLRALIRSIQKYSPTENSNSRQ